MSRKSRQLSFFTLTLLSCNQLRDIMSRKKLTQWLASYRVLNLLIVSKKGMQVPVIVTLTLTLHFYLITHLPCLIFFPTTHHHPPIRLQTSKIVFISLLTFLKFFCLSLRRLILKNNLTYYYLLSTLSTEL
jgi:hypothetical protein